MATLTRNLFWGQGERDHRLKIVEGHWPSDVDGSVFVIGPDKRSPGGHWFGAHGLVEKIHLTLDADGRLLVEHRRVDTPLNRIRRRLPFLFKQIQFMEISPFGITNAANTNVQPIDDRLFVGFDGGRPLEIDPESLEYLTPVGANSEWLQAAPGILEPLCAVAAHPAPDFDEHRLYFINYNQIAPPGTAPATTVARWDMEGPIQRWPLEGMSPFDTIHDIKATANHLVFSDLPFVIEPETFRGAARTRRNQEHTNLWIIAKSDLDATSPGKPVRVVEVQLPMPTGHLYVDTEDSDGVIRVMLQHIPLGDLMITMDRESIEHRNGTAVDPNYEGLIALALQPSVVGRYRIDAASGAVLESDIVHDDRVWGGVLPTTDTYRPGARARQRQLWYAGMGFDPDLVPEEWWRLYADASDGIVAPAELPEEAIPGSLSRFDLEAMKVVEVHRYAPGAFPSPPTFVPRAGSDDPDDGYVVVVVHQDGPKEIQIFDALHIERGPLARATAPAFSPNLMLHSCWMPPRKGPRPSDYNIALQQDLVGAVSGVPGVVANFGRMARAMRPSPGG